MAMLRVAILDDYAGAALASADWSQLDGIGSIDVFQEHLSEDEAIQVLQPFDVLCTIRERMAFPRRLFEMLPNLKLVTIIGTSLPNLDMDAATDHGVLIIHPDLDNPKRAGTSNATPELAWGLMIATVRHLALEDRRMREGRWQSSLGINLSGRTLGLLGLGNIGRRMAEYGHAFGMNVIAWSQNLSVEGARDVGVRRVDKDALFAESDIVSIHVRLSDRTRGLVTARELGLMKATAYIINTSRGPIVDETALVTALGENRIAGAGLDVFDQEPLAADHPLRRLENATLTPHLGYVTHETLSAFYSDMPAAIAAFAGGAPIRVINTEALKHPRVSVRRNPPCPAGE
jgi:phosphoglycerate dehydrogenase-like enzyme